MSCCAIATCQNNARKTEKSLVVYHRFPRDPDICKLWVLKCKREDIVNCKNARICSDHFAPEDYADDMKNRLLNLPTRKCLRTTAVPTIKLPQGSSATSNRTGSSIMEETIEDSTTVQDQASDLAIAWDGSHPTTSDQWKGSPQPTREEEGHTDVESCQELGLTHCSGGELNIDSSSMAHMERPAGVMDDTLDWFGKYVSSILRQLPVTTAYTLQQTFINEVISAKLLHEKKHPSRPSYKNCSASTHPEKSTKTKNLREDCTKTSTNQNTTKSTKEVRESVHMPESQPTPPPFIKEEQLEDFDLSSDLRGDSEVDDSVLNETPSHIEIEEGPDPSTIKSELEIFEVVYCDEFQDQAKAASSTSFSRRLEEVPSSSSSTAWHDRKQIFNCSMCSLSCSKRENLKRHYNEKHSGLNPHFKYKPVSKEKANSKKPRLEAPSLITDPPDHSHCSSICGD